jgi:peptidylprolyl isomerase
MMVRVGLLVIVVGGVVAAVFALQGDDDEEVASQNTTTTSSVPAAESAAGKPCVPVSDTPPAGAPNVPVKVGPPPTELVKEDLKPGTGAAVAANSTVTVHYIGVSCSTGKVFDSSYSRGQPATFPLSGVIVGWQEGIPGMNVGGQRLLGIPPHKGYGQNGSPPHIAPNETLWFVVEVLDAKAG